jgi:acetyl esterase/lipase
MKWFFVSVLLVAAGAAFFYTRSGPALLDLIDRLTPGPGAARVGSDIAFGNHAQTLDVWRTGEAKPKGAPVLVFYYGGGWAKGTARDYGFAARAYASKGFVVVVPDYRKVPQVRFPIFIQDAADAVKWTQDNIAKFGGDPNRIAIAGHSAGAHSVAMIALDPRWLAAAGASGAVKAAVGLSGPYDFYPFTGAAIEAMGKWPHPAETQPLTYARKDVPPMMLVTGTADTTVRPKNARNLFKALAGAGAVVVEKEYPGLGHEDVAMALSLPFRGKATVLDDSSAFLMTHLKEPK